MTMTCSVLRTNGLFRSFALALLIALLLVPAAQAALLVTIGSTTLSTGGSGSVDVTISSDSGTDLLSLFGFEFRISTLGPTQLDFLSPQSDGQLLDAAYVLAGDSLTVDAGIEIGTVTTTVVPHDTFVGGDATLSGLDIPVPMTPALLVRLDLTSLTALPPVVGDQFFIQLVHGPNTFFLDSGFADLPFSSTNGTVTVVEIPEPAALILQAIAFVVLVAAAIRRQAASI